MRKLYLALVMGLLMGAGAQAQEIWLDHYTLGDGINIAGDAGYSVRVRGYVQPYFDAKWFTDPNIENSANRFRIRRARLRLSGKDQYNRFTWRLQADLSGTAEVETEGAQFLMDAWVGYNISKRWRIRVGQKNTPTDNRELQIRSHTLQLVERSRVTSAFSTIREFGMFVDGTVALPRGMYLKPSVVITNGDGLNVFNPDFGGLKYGGRIDFLPLGLFTNMGQFHEVDIMRELTPRLVFGVAYSYNVGMSSRRGRTSGDILYLNDDDEYSLPNFSKLGIDFMFKYRGWCVVGEFVSTGATVPEDITQRVRNDGSTSTSFPVEDENGETVQDVENYVKGRMMLGAGYNITVGYLFKNRISVDARYTFLDADQHSFLNNGTFYNRPKYYTLGISKYFTRYYGAKVQASIDYVETAEGSNDLNGDPMDGNEWQFRIITSFAF